MIIKLANKTDSTVNVEKLIEQLESKEIEFSTIDKLADSKLISHFDFSKIYFATQNPLEGNTNPGCGTWDIKNETFKPIRKSLDYQLSNK